MIEKVVSELTPPGRGAICVLGVRAADVTARVGQHFHTPAARQLSGQPRQTPLYGYWVDARGLATDTGGTREDVIVCLKSESELEIHCHGGQFAKQRILQALREQGFRPVAAHEFVARRTPRGTARVAQRFLAQTTTVRTAAVLHWQACGALDHMLHAIIDELNDGRASGALGRIDELLQWQELGRHLLRPWRVLVAGRPNVGKSSLINQMLGYQRAIVFDQPGTTRDLLVTPTAIEGWPVELIDSAGLRDGGDQIEVAGIELTRQALSDADLIIELHDAVGWPGSFPSGDSVHSTPRLLVINKCDLGQPEIPGDDRRPWIPISALTGAGVPGLWQAIAKHLVPCQPPHGQAVPFLVGHADLLKQARRHIEAADWHQAIESIQKIQEVGDEST